MLSQKQKIFLKILLKNKIDKMLEEDKYPVISIFKACLIMENLIDEL